MAIWGRRNIKRQRTHDVYWCICGDDEHRMMIWFPAEDDEFEWAQIDIQFGHGWTPWRYRLGQALAMLRGQRATRSFVTLDYADLVHLRDGLNDVIARIESVTDEESV